VKQKGRRRDDDEWRGRIIGYRMGRTAEEL
jgi:hypothetical protein